jgi:hypothetical protein
MKIKHIIFCIFSVILILIVYNLYANNNDNFYTEPLDIENFESVLKGLNKNNNKKKKKTNSNNNDNDYDNSNDNLSYNSLELKKSLKKLKSKKTGTTFDDLFKATENMNPDKLSLTNIKEELFNYNNSFKKEKFKNISQNTAESFEKFGLYKEKFFEIFK